MEPMILAKAGLPSISRGLVMTAGQHSETRSEPEVKTCLKAAIEQHRAGQLIQAEKLYQRVLQHPSCDRQQRAEAYNNLGITLQQQNKWQEAAGAYRRAMEEMPTLVEAYFNLGTVLQAQERSSAAILAYQEAVQLQPDYIEVYYNLGRLYHQQGLLLEAEQTYRQGLNYRPDDVEVQKALGHLCYEQHRLEEAQNAYEKVIQIDPQDAKAHYSLGVTLKALGNSSAAIQAYVQALRCNPDYFEAHNNLGTLLQEAGRFDLAIQAFQQALKCQPNYARGYANLGAILKSQNRLTEAMKAYGQALVLQPSLFQARLGLCISQLPIIYESAAEVEERRGQYHQQLQALFDYYQKALPQERAEAARDIGLVQPFYLTYQGQNDRELQALYGQLMTQLMACRFPQWSQPLAKRKVQSHEKIRVGIVSGFFHNHSNWKIPIKGWVQQLDRDRFELWGYYTRARQDEETAIAAQSFDSFIQGPLALEEWAKLIQADQLDVLIFPEFGMDMTTLQLGCLRLSPTQVTSWGHPETSGLPTIDYCLSSDLMEPPQGQEYYTENLVRLPNLSIYYEPLALSIDRISKADIGLEEQQTLYWCCQSLYKYLPQHDDIFPRIAKQVDHARFVFIAHHSDPVNEVFRKRLHLAFQAEGLDHETYCIFLPEMKVNRFAGVAAIADVFLDSLGWSGCNSSFESLAHQTPIVTCPGELMRSRHTLAILKMMELEEAIAYDKSEYIRIAIRLGLDPVYRMSIAQKIAMNRHRLYWDLEAIQALEAFLLESVEQV